MKFVAICLFGTVIASLVIWGTRETLSKENKNSATVNMSVDCRPIHVQEMYDDSTLVFNGHLDDRPRKNGISVVVSRIWKGKIPNENIELDNGLNGGGANHNIQKNKEYVFFIRSSENTGYVLKRCDWIKPVDLSADVINFLESR